MIYDCKIQNTSRGGACIEMMYLYFCSSKTTTSVKEVVVLLSPSLMSSVTAQGFAHFPFGNWHHIRPSET